MEATAAYLRTLREHAGISRARLAAQLDVSEMSIWRIEEEGQEPRAELLGKLVRAVRARWEDIDALLADATATSEDGKRRAEDYIALAETMSDAELDAAINLLERLRGDPRALNRWLGYGERLAEERAPDETP